MWYWHHTAVEKQLKWAHCWEYLGQELLSCGLLRAFWLENSAQPGFDLKTSGAQWSGILANSLTHDLLANPPLAVAHITTSQIVFGRLEWAPKSQMTDSKNCAANVIWTPRHPHVTVDYTGTQQRWRLLTRRTKLTTWTCLIWVLSCCTFFTWMYRLVSSLVLLFALARTLSMILSLLVTHASRSLISFFWTFFSWAYLIWSTFRKKIVLVERAIIILKNSWIS